MNLTDTLVFALCISFLGNLLKLLSNALLVCRLEAVKTDWIEQVTVTIEFSLGLVPVKVLLHFCHQAFVALHFLQFAFQLPNGLVTCLVERLALTL